jgi:hypothetical protein
MRASVHTSHQDNVHVMVFKVVTSRDLLVDLFVDTSGRVAAVTGLYKCTDIQKYSCLVIVLTVYGLQARNTG